MTSLKNAFKEFRRDKDKKRKSSSSSQPRTEKKRLPGSTIFLSPPIVQSGLFHQFCWNLSFYRRR